MNVKGNRSKSLHLSGINLEYVECGSGRPILFLHPSIGLSADLPFLGHLSQHGRVVAPSHPGFGHSSLPRHFSTVDDLAYFYLDLLEHLDFRDCVIVGVSFGAWIAAEMCIKSCERIESLVLAAPVGIKLGGADESHIADYFSLQSDHFIELAYADRANAHLDPSTLSEEQCEIIARNRDATALYGWLPFMYDPKLGGRIHRIKIPSLVIKGSMDRILSDTYPDEYARLLPAGQLAVLADSGHFPHIEQPQALADQIGRFLKSDHHA